MKSLPLFALLTLTMAAPLAEAFETKAQQAVVVDHTTQTVLLAKNADSKMYPSSMSKLMTLYVLFDKLKSGALTLDSTFSVSEKAWKKGGSKMFVEVNSQVQIEDLIRGIIVQSGNDACIEGAEALGGSEEGFAKLMNDKARQLGLSASHFVNATGWPDEQHFMSAYDLARLTEALIRDFPDYYPYFSEKEFTYSGITQPNRNGLLGRGFGVDGLKTGHTEAAGYGITISAKSEQTGRRVNVVVNGLQSEQARLNEARRLAEYGLREFVEHEIGGNGKTIAQLAIWNGSDAQVDLVLPKSIKLTLPRDHSKIRFMLVASQPVQAPFGLDEKLGLLVVYNGEDVMAQFPLYPKVAGERAGVLMRFWRNLRIMISEEG